jgi:hypothetical protein
MQSFWLLAFLLLAAAAPALFVFGQARLSRIERYPFPPYLADRLAHAYPELSPEHRARVIAGLREFFVVAAMARGRRIAMPSRAVDAAWHEFILSTRAYREFCDRALGRFLHHTPAEAMASPTHAQEGIQRTWRLACRREGIDPARPSRLPMLFALDAQLAIPEGFVYALNCQRGASERGDGGGAVYCAGHIGGCGSGGCGGDAGCSGDGGGGCGGD